LIFASFFRSFSLWSHLDQLEGVQSFSITLFISLEKEMANGLLPPTKLLANHRVLSIVSGWEKPHFLNSP